MERTLRRRLQAEARRRGISLSQLVSEAVEAALEKPSWIPMKSLEIKGCPRDGSTRYKELIGKEPHE